MFKFIGLTFSSVLAKEREGWCSSAIFSFDVVENTFYSHSTMHSAERSTPILLYISAEHSTRVRRALISERVPLFATASG